MAKPPKKKFIPLAKMAPGAARNKRVAALAGSPGTRSKIPTALLPAKYRAGRIQAQKIKTENATLYNPAQILSGNDLRGAVKGIVNAQINPQLGAFDRGIKSLTGQRDVSGARLGQYMDMYSKDTAGSAAALSNSGQQLVAQIAQQGQQTQDVLSRIQSDDSSRRSADVALRGEGLQGPDQAAQALNLAKTNAAGATASATGQAAAQATGTSNLAGTIAAVAPMRAQDSMMNLANTFNKQIVEMQGRRAETEAQRGPLTAQTLEKMRQDQFTNLATMKGLNLKESDLQETVRSHKAEEALANKTLNVKSADSVRDARTQHEKNLYKARKDRADLDIKRGIDPITGKPLPKKPESASEALNRWRLKFARDHGYLPKTGPPTKSKVTPRETLPGVKHATIPQTTKAQTDFSAISQAIKNAQADFPGNRASAGTGAVKAIIGEKPTTDPLLASIAADMTYDGHISRTNTLKLKKRGINVADLDGVVSYTEWKRQQHKRKIGRNVPGVGAA